MKQAQQILNYAVILEAVQKNYRFNLSHDYTDQFLRVETKFAKVAELQQYTEMFYLDQAKMSLPDMAQLHSFKTILRKSTQEQIFEIREFLQIKDLYLNVQTLINFYDKNKENLTDKDRIQVLLTPLQENLKLVQSIKKVIANNGEINDDASTTLYGLRQEQKQIEQSIRSTLQNLLHQYQNQLAENLFTLRNNRYVLPIKAEFKNTFSGILHDQSASGTTAYIEPQSIVNINNRLQQIEIEEKREIERLLFELSQKVFEVHDELKQNAWGLARLDVYMAKASYAYSHGHYKVEVLPEQRIELYDAWHPLLNKQATVKNDVFLGDKYSILMITGANTGGKSVFLKMIGTLVLMAQTGLFLPVSRDRFNKIGVFQNIYIDIGDEQSLEQNLSTFSAHITNMKQILERSNEKTLVLLDELGSGTDPIQGSALGISILEALYEKKALVVGTTHFNEVKEFIAKTTYAENAAMIFNVETLTPTYRIRYGSYGASYAFDIAKSLNLPEEIIIKAKTYADNFSDNAQELLAVYEQRLRELDDLAGTLTTKEQTLAKEEIELTQKKQRADQEIERERKTVLASAEKKLAEKMKKVDGLLEELKSKQSLKQNEHADIKGTLNQLQQDANNQGQQRKKMAPKNNVALQENDIVYVQSLQSNGTLLKQQGKKWLVKIGNLSMTLPEKELIFVKREQQTAKTEMRNVKRSMRAVAAKLDLRGMRVLEGLEALENYLANARSEHDVVRIIHGHGTGSMRDAVQTALKQNKFVKSYRFGGEGEGGVGATVVEFK